MVAQIRYRFYLGVSQEHFLSDLRKVTGLPWTFTSFPGVGMWLGQREDSTVIELITEEQDLTPTEAEEVAGELARIYEQDAVLLTKETVAMALVEPYP